MINKVYRAIKTKPYHPGEWEKVRG
jgi:hypothetical protein